MLREIFVESSEQGDAAQKGEAVEENGIDVIVAATQEIKQRKYFEDDIVS